MPARSWTTAAVLPHQPVEQRALADVRPPDDGDAWHGRPIVVLDRGLGGPRVGLGEGRLAKVLGKQLDDPVEQVAGPSTVQRTHRDGLADAQAHELPHLGLAALVVGLVGDHDHVGARPPDPVGDVRIVVGQPDRCVDHEQHDVGTLDGSLHLAAHLGVELVATRHPTTGVDHAERDVEPFGLEFLAVTRDAGAVLHDRLLAAHDAIEQRALADIRSPDDDHRGQLVRRVSAVRLVGRLVVRLVGRLVGRLIAVVIGVFGIHGCSVPARADADSRALRSAMPSVSMISTTRGSSSIVVPSRKRPSSDRQTSGSR